MKAHALLVLAENALQLTSTKPVFSEAGDCAKFGSTHSIGETDTTNIMVLASSSGGVDPLRNATLQERNA